jgi:hypothetical protein
VELEDAYHAANIVVPLTYNDPGAGMNFINGTVSTLIPRLCIVYMMCFLSREPLISMGEEYSSR